jgi:hypothetical protein
VWGLEQGTIVGIVALVAVASGWLISHKSGVRLQHKAMQLGLMNEMRRELVGDLDRYLAWLIRARALVSTRAVWPDWSQRQQDPRWSEACDRFDAFLQETYGEFRSLWDLEQRVEDAAVVFPPLKNRVREFAALGSTVKDSWSEWFTAACQDREGTAQRGQIASASSAFAATLEQAALPVALLRKEFQRMAMSVLVHETQLRHTKPEC